MFEINSIVIWIIQGAVVILITVLWYLLRQRDEHQAHDIRLLWEKHDQDAKDLVNLRLQIAGRHYERSELDAKFDKLDNSIITGFANMGAQFKVLSDTLLKHMSKEEGRKEGSNTQ